MRAPPPETIARLPDGGRFVALDSLRGVAALAVAASHIPSLGPLFSLAPVRHAPLLVDFFFVLSGLVIAAAYGERLRRGFSLARFALLRVGRLYPLHVVVLAAWFALELAKLAVLDPGAAFTDGFSGGQLLLTALLLHAFDADSTLAWNGPSWSISVEIWLYLAFALLWRVAGANRWWLVATAIVTAAMLLLLAFEVPAFGTPFSEYIARGLAGFGLGTLGWHAWQAGVGERLASMSDAALAGVQGAVLLAAIAALSIARHRLCRGRFWCLLVSSRSWPATAGGSCGCSRPRRW